MDFSQDGTMLATISQESLILMVFNSSTGEKMRSIQAQPVSGWKHELKSVVIGNSASDTTKPLIFVYSTFSNTTRKQLIGAITALKPEVSAPYIGK
jgi:hypothetical protein